MKLPGRAKLLIAVAGLLVIIFATRSCQGVDISREEAIATAQAALEAHPLAFAPEETEAKILRQGFPPNPMWVVVFTVGDPDGGSQQFLHHGAIWVDGRTGAIRQVNVSTAEGG